MTYLAMETQDGQRQIIKLDGPGGEIRVAVGKPGRRSGVWWIGAKPSKNDVYVGIRGLTGVQKFSLHQSGDWRHQWVSGNHAAASMARTGSRILDQWPRPAETALGWARALSIWVPEQDVTDVPNDHQGEEGVRWIPPPDQGYAIGVHLVLMKPDRGVEQLAQTFPIAGFDLVGGESLVVLASVVQVDEDKHQWLAAQRLHALTEVQSMLEHADPSSLRITLYGQSDDGERMAWDLAVTPARR